MPLDVAWSVVRVTWEQYLKPSRWGFIGSVIGVLFGAWSTYAVFGRPPIHPSEFLLYRLLFVGWFILQGIGFFTVYRRYKDSLSFVAFEYGLLSALLLAVVCDLLGTVYSGLRSLDLLSHFAEAMYLIIGGGSIIGVERRTNQTALFTLAGIVFMAAGALLGLGRFALELGSIFYYASSMYESGVFLVIVVNLLACLVFYHLMGEDMGKGTVVASDSGVEVQ